MRKFLLTAVLGTTLSLTSVFAIDTFDLVPYEAPGMTRALVKYETPQDSLVDNKLALVPYDAEFAEAQARKAQQAPQETWGQWALSNGLSAAKYVGGKLVESTAETAKYVAAWNLNYYGVNVLEDLTAYGFYAGAALVGGPAAGDMAYYATKYGIKVARWFVPGVDGFIAGTYAPLTKALIIDPLVNNAPAIASAAVSTVSTCASYAKSAGSAAYNYFWG